MYREGRIATENPSLRVNESEYVKTRSSRISGGDED